MYRGNAPVWTIKERATYFHRDLVSDQLLTFSFSQRNGTEHIPVLFFVSIQGDKFPLYVLVFCFHCILLLFKTPMLFKKNTQVDYIKRIYKQSLGNSLANIMNS